MSNPTNKKKLSTCLIINCNTPATGDLPSLLERQRVREHQTKTECTRLQQLLTDHMRKEGSGKNKLTWGKIFRQLSSRSHNVWSVISSGYNFIILYEANGLKLWHRVMINFATKTKYIIKIVSTTNSFLKGHCNKRFNLATKTKSLNSKQIYYKYCVNHKFVSKGPLWQAI